MLLNHLSEITDSQHYLVKTSIHYDEYLHSLNKILNALQAKIGEKKPTASSEKSCKFARGYLTRVNIYRLLAS